MSHLVKQVCLFKRTKWFKLFQIGKYLGLNRRRCVPGAVSDIPFSGSLPTSASYRGTMVSEVTKTLIINEFITPQALLCTNSKQEQRKQCLYSIRRESTTVVMSTFKILHLCDDVANRSSFTSLEKKPVSKGINVFPVVTVSFCEMTNVVSF